MFMHEPASLDRLLAICKDQGILTIADEVMTGFGRTGNLFACDHLTLKPDIFCFSKGLTGGTMSFGATTCTQGLYDAFLPRYQLRKGLCLPGCVHSCGIWWVSFILIKKM